MSFFQSGKSKSWLRSICHFASSMFSISLEATFNQHIRVFSPSPSPYHHHSQHHHLLQQSGVHGLGKTPPACRGIRYHRHKSPKQKFPHVLQLQLHYKLHVMSITLETPTWWLYDVENEDWRWWGCETHIECVDRHHLNNSLRWKKSVPKSHLEKNVI